MESPDRPVLSNFLSNVGGSLYAAAQRVDPKAIADTVAAAAGQVSERVAATAGQVSERLLSSAEQAALETKMKHLQSEAANDAAAATVGIAPWLTLGEQFSILEDELKLRILKIASNEANFTKSTALEVRRRPGNILPGCLPMAEAALTEDAVLKALRFKLVPASLTEEEFWRCYFWHVANIKCDLLHDWRSANGARRDAVLEEEAALAPVEQQQQPEQQEQQQQPVVEEDTVEDLDAEFERLIASPS